jgi:hypothetical protein
LRWLAGRPIETSDLDRVFPSHNASRELPVLWPRPEAVS